MKKLLVTAIIATAATLSALASPPFRLGVRVGFNSSNISEVRSAKTLDMPQWRKGFIAGVEMDMPLIAGFHLAPGFFFDHRNNDYAGVEGNVQTFGSVTSSWFQFQLMGSYHISPLKFASVHFDFGPYVAYGVGGNDKCRTITYDDPFPSTEVIFKQPTFGSDGNYFRTDWGFKTGVALVVADHCYLGAHYLLGLRNLSWHKAVIDNSMARAWEFTLGYNF